MKPTFSVIVPTTGRPTLVNALRTVASQLKPGDELLVLCNDDGDLGTRARNNLIARSQASNLVFLDDDDEWVPNALDAMRRFATEHPNRVGIFQRRHEFHHDEWQRKSLAEYCTCMGVIPNIPGKVGTWAPVDTADPLLRAPRSDETIEAVALRWHDYEFIRSTLELRGDEPLWVPVVTTLVRPEYRWWKRLRYKVRLRTRLRMLFRRMTSEKATASLL